MDTRLPIRGLGLCSGRAKRPFFREILGVKVRVNLLAEVLRESDEKEENGNAWLSRAYSLSLSNISLHIFLNCFPFVVALKGFGPSSFRATSSKLNLG